MGKKCRSRYCYSEPSPKARSPYCPKCKSRRYRAKHQLVSTLDSRKRRAEQRGIPWDITLDQWAAFCLRTNYLELKGTGPNDMCIDRINVDPRKGVWWYHIDNIRMITNSENSIKGNKEKKQMGMWSTPSVYQPGDPF
jgi:hypothetical protein